MNVSRERHHFLDNIRIFLTFLVVAHHAGRAFGRWSGWWFVKVPQAEQTVHLIPFFAINAAFLMTFFFFISAYFMPGSFDRKGYVGFLRERIRRMLVPLIIFVLVIMPIESYYYYKLFMVPNSSCSGCIDLDFFKYYYLVYLGIGGKPTGWDLTEYPTWPAINLGHIWFIEHLLIYGLIYAIYRKFNKPVSIQLKFPNNGRIAVSGLFLGIFAYFVRIFFPINDWMGLFYFFQVEFGHFPHYIFSLFVGVAAFRHDWISQTNFTKKFGILWLSIGLAGISIILFIGARIPLDSPEVQGGFGVLSLVYSIVEVFTCFGLILGILWFSMNYLNHFSKITEFLAKNSYMVYLIHQPFIILIQYWLYAYPISADLKFVVCFLLALPLSFLLSHVIRSLVPYAKKYL